MYSTVMALQEHLTDTRRYAEVTVNLERWMRIKQVGIGSSLGVFLLHVIIRQDMQHVLDNLQCMVTILHSGPEIGFPTQTPSSSHITTLYQGGTGSLKEFGMCIGRYLIRWIESIEMGDMTVVVLRGIPVLQPFLQLSVLSHLHRGQSCQCCLIGFYIQ